MRYDPGSFANKDEYLKKEAARVVRERKELGLEGLVGGLDSVLVQTEPDRIVPAASDYLRYTGMQVIDAFRNEVADTIVLGCPGSPRLILQSRKVPAPQFEKANDYPEAKALPHTRLETYIFRTPNLKEYVDIQKGRGVEFLSDDVVETEDFRFIQTCPSRFTGNSLGFVERKAPGYRYRWGECGEWYPKLEKPGLPYLADIGRIDHAATRVRAKERDEAVIEFMELTNYHFDFAIYVETLNSITNVARLSAEDFAMVFTSGISPYLSDEESGPTERFIHRFGPRTHHLAFATENIDETYEAIKADGMEFLVELVGSPDEGLKQTFTEPSEHTFLINEYIHRYGDFDGFFTRSNVTLLTKATEKQ